MTTRSLLPAALLLTLTALLSCNGPRTQPESEPAFLYAPITEDVVGFTSDLDRLMPRLLAGYGVPGTALALVHHGALAWAAGYGVADRERHTPVTPDTVFRVYSISKSVTAWGVLRLVEQGRLDLDAPVARYLRVWPLPPSAFDPQAVTVRGLLSHTAGVSPRPSGREAHTLLQSLAQDSAEEPAHLAYPVGEFHYSDHGYGVLQLVVEAITGERFADFMRREVLAPLGMRAADFNLPPTVRRALATGYDPTAQASEGVANSYPGAFVESAAYGLNASALDIAHFMAAGMADEDSRRAGRGVLPPARVDEMFTAAPGAAGVHLIAGDAYGLGYGLRTLPGGTREVSHGGGSPGWKTLFAQLPDLGEGIVVLTNGTRGDQLFQHVLCEWQNWAVPGAPQQSCGSLYDLYVMRSDGTAVRPLTDAPASDLFPSLSPNAQTIAFESNRDRNWNIYTINADGSHQHRLTTSTEDDLYPAWSPGGRHIAFTSNRAGNNDIYVMAADGSHQTRLTSDPADEILPAWSPDGTRLVFVRGAGSDGGPPHNLWVMNADGSEQRRLTNEPSDDLFPTWSPDGSRVSYDAGDDLSVVRADGTDRTRITSGDLHVRGASWSPDGRRLAFAGAKDGISNIFVVNVDGTDQVQLTNGPASALHPAWSADGSLIAFASNRRTGH